MQSPSTHNFCITSSKHINYQLVSWPCVLDHQHVTLFISSFILCFWLCFYNEQFSSMNSWLKLNSIHVLYFYILQSLISLCPDCILGPWTLPMCMVRGVLGRFLASHINKYCTTCSFRIGIPTSVVTHENQVTDHTTKTQTPILHNLKSVTVLRYIGLTCGAAISFL